MTKKEIIRKFGEAIQLIEEGGEFCDNKEVGIGVTCLCDIYEDIMTNHKGEDCYREVAMAIEVATGLQLYEE